MRALFFALLMTSSLAASAGQVWWIMGPEGCKIAEFSPQQAIDLGGYKVDQYYEKKGVIILLKGDNSLYYASTQESCLIIAEAFDKAKRNR
jgi:hypothetical protein